MHRKKMQILMLLKVFREMLKIFLPAHPLFFSTPPMNHSIQILRVNIQQRKMMCQKTLIYRATVTAKIAIKVTMKLIVAANQSTINQSDRLSNSWRVRWQTSRQKISIKVFYDDRQSTDMCVEYLACPFEWSKHHLRRLPAVSISRNLNSVISWLLDFILK